MKSTCWLTVGMVQIEHGWWICHGYVRNMYTPTICARWCVRVCMCACALGISMWVKMHLLITRNTRHIWSSNSLAEIKAFQRKSLLKIWFKGLKKIKINVLELFQKYLVIHPTTVSATGAGHYIDICIKFLCTCVCPPLPGSSYSLIQLSWGSCCTYHQVLNKNCYIWVWHWMLTKHHIESRKGLLSQRAHVLTRLRKGKTKTVPLYLFAQSLSSLHRPMSRAKRSCRWSPGLLWILLELGSLDRSPSVISCVSECSRGNSSAPFLFHGMTSAAATVALKWHRPLCGQASLLSLSNWKGSR